MARHLLPASPAWGGSTFGRVVVMMLHCRSSRNARATHPPSYTRSSPLAKRDYMLRTVETRDVGGGDRDEESGCCGVSVAGRRDGVPGQVALPVLERRNGEVQVRRVGRD